MINRVIILCLLLIFISGSAFAESDTIGTVKTSKGNVKITRNNIQHPVDIGFEINQNDFIKTGKDGAIGIIFVDNTVLSLGPSTELFIDEYIFAPQKSKLSMIIRMLKGTASYLSGIIGKQAPESVTFKTPDATIGTRGTKFLVKVQ